MKRFLTVILSTLIIGLFLVNPVSAKTSNSVTNANQNATFSISDANDLLSNTLSQKEYKKLLLKAPLEVYNRAKKIVDFYNLAYGDSFAHLYHPNADLSINEEEILQDLPNDNSLCIMLFGNKLNEDGSMSDKLIARCMTALAMANKYPNALIMITGGHTAGWDHDSEARVCRKWLTEHGIDAKRIVIDEISWDTGSNVLCTFTTSDLRKHKEINSFVVVSSDYHVPRCSFCLMSYIYLFGLDKPVKQGGKGYKFLGNIGAVLD